MEKRKCENRRCSRILTPLCSARCCRFVFVESIKSAFFWWKSDFHWIIIIIWMVWLWTPPFKKRWLWKKMLRQAHSFFELNIFRCKVNCKLQTVMNAKYREKKVWCFNHVVLVSTMTTSINNRKITSYRHQHWTQNTEYTFNHRKIDENK